MFIEQLLNLEVLIWGLHDVIEVAVYDFEVGKCTNVTLCRDLWADCDIRNGCKLYLLHER